MPVDQQLEADLSLRASGRFVRPRVMWPPDAPDDSPVAVFLCGGDPCTDVAEAVCAGLCTEAGFVVLAVPTPDLDVATTTFEWTADHATELGADPGRLHVAGMGRGGRLAAAVAMHVRDSGWPPLTRQVLIRPDLAGWTLGPGALTGVAPATVVNGGEYANRLRRAGVDVVDLYVQEPMSFGWMRGLRD
jgi:acetyl esterase/lipase